MEEKREGFVILDLIIPNIMISKYKSLHFRQSQIPILSDSCSEKRKHPSVFPVKGKLKLEIFKIIIAFRLEFK